MRQGSRPEQGELCATSRPGADQGRRADARDRSRPIGRLANNALRRLYPRNYHGEQEFDPSRATKLLERLAGADAVGRGAAYFWDDLGKDHLPWMERYLVRF